MATQGQYLAEGENMSAVRAMFDAAYEAAYMNDQEVDVFHEELQTRHTDVLTEV